MKPDSTYCEHEWPIKHDLGANPLGLKRFLYGPRDLGKKLAGLHLRLFLPEDLDFRFAGELSSVGECRKALDAAARDELNGQRPLSTLSNDELVHLLQVARASVRYLVGQRKPPTELPGFQIASLELREEVGPLLRDALTACHFSLAKLQHDPHWAWNYACYLSLLTYWDQASLIPSSLVDRVCAYAGLLTLHTGLPAIEAPRNYPAGCLKSFFGSLWEANPGAVLEALSWLQADPNDAETWALYDKLTWQEPAGTHLSGNGSNLVKLLSELEVDPSALLLGTFARMDQRQREVFLGLSALDSPPFDLPELGADLQDSLHVRSVELQDIGWAFSAIAHNIQRGRVSINLSDKVSYFHRALDHVADLRNDWGTCEWFQGGTRMGRVQGPPLQHTLNRTEEILLNSLRDLPLSLRDVTVKRWVAQRFYFTLLVDHENFWSALVTWMRRTRPDIAKFKSGFQSTCLFEPDLKYVKKPWQLPTAPVLLAQYGRERYEYEHRCLFYYVLSKVIFAANRHCGVSAFDYKSAVAFWRGTTPYLHRDTYNDFGIHTLEPEIKYGKHAEAADRTIAFLMANTIWTNALGLAKRPFYIIVAGDADYLETLNVLKEQGADYQIWLFKHQMSDRMKANVGPERLVCVDDLLEFEKLSTEMLFSRDTSA